MKKTYLTLIVAFIAAAFYIVSSDSSFSEKIQYFGDADALGADEDANARYNYELMRLHDPATGKIPAHVRERELAFAANLPKEGSISAMGRITSVSWVQRGPWNVGGRTRAFGVDVSNENNLIAGSCSGGMWRSTDQGRTWAPTTPSNQYKSVSCLTQDTRPGHTNIWYYGTGEAYGASASQQGSYYLGNGIYKSTDSGVSWHLLAATTSSITALDSWGDMIWNVATDPSNITQDVVYAASYGAIYRSTDGGTSWGSAPVLGLFGSSYFTDVAVSMSGVVYATLSSDGGARGIYRSSDGIVFTNITPGNFPASYNRVKIGISPSDENQVYFLGNTPGSGTPDTNYVGDIEWNSLWRYTYISGDGSGSGGVWQDRSANLPTTGGLFDKFTSQGSYDLVVKVKPDDTNVVFIGGTNLYRSTSGFADNRHTTFIGGYKQGATLPVVDMYLNHHPDQHELQFLPSNPNRMFSANDGGIFYTNDNTVPSVLWSSLNNGYLTSMFYTCAIDHATTNDIVIGGAQDNGSWFTNVSSPTSPWVTPRGGDGSFCAIADYSSAYYFSIQNGKVMRAKLDGSGNVDSFARIDPIGGRNYLFVNPFVLDPNNNNRMYLAGGKSLWRNNNLSGIPYASNWDSISTNWFRFPDSGWTLGYQITAIAVSKNPANRLYIGTKEQRVFRLDSADIVTHAPRSITATSGSVIFPAGSYVNCIAVDPNNADNIIAVFSNYGVNSLFYSSDGGKSWKKIGGNLEAENRNGSGDGPSCRWASIIPVKGGTVYLVGTTVGLFATTQLSDTSTVWIQQGVNTIGASVVDMIDYRLTDGLIVVATHSGGIFSTHITQVADINKVSDPSAAAASLNLTNYPNPFTGETFVRFELKQSAQVTVQLFDQAGRLVETVASGQMHAGQQKYSIAGTGLPPGIYFCKVIAGELCETRRIIRQ